MIDKYRFRFFSNSIILFLTAFIFPFLTFSQTVLISGKFINAKDNSPVQGVGIMLSLKSDSTKFKQTLSDANGVFIFKNISPDKYVLKAFFMGFRTIRKEINIDASTTNIGTFKLYETSANFKGVTVEEKAIRSIERNDTTEFNANAYKVNPDANAQDLITKMPGITVDNTGAVKAQGENVQKVLIDGKEYFGDDATIALKNLPAEIIDKIQVFDKMSDQAQFTGFDDGNSQKTLNIVTRQGKSNGTFGKVYAGYGTDDKYSAGENLNFFQGKRRISIIGLTNNINQQNFSNQDLLGVQGGNGGSGRGGFGGGGGGQSGISNFLVGNQNGINTTHSLGLNYSDSWGKQIVITSSYFFNDATNSTSKDLTRNYLFGKSANQLYHENDTSTTENINHRFNLRFEYNIDTSNSIIITPKFSYQTNNSGSSMFASNFDSARVIVNKTGSYTVADNSGYSFSNNILLRHKFSAQGRTISWNIGTAVNQKSGTNTLNSKNDYYQSKSDTIISDSASNFDQLTTTSQNGYTLSTSLNYTEPIGKKGLLMVNYTPSVTVTNSDQETNFYDSLSHEYNYFKDTLSSKYSSNLNTEKGGVSYRLRLDKGMVMVGLNYQWVGLTGSQIFPSSLQINRTFSDYLPSAMIMYRFTKSKTLRIFYRTSTNQPSVSQLQNTIDNSNPLLLNSGNPNLNESYSHTVITRYSASNVEKGTTFFVLMNANYVNNYIGNATFIGTGHILPETGTLLARGAQYSMPVNLDGYWNLNSFVTYGFPVKFVKSNLNFNAGVTYNRTPGLIGEDVNNANTYGVNSGIVLGSNISSEVDFTISYSGSYNSVENSIQSSLNSNYFLQITSGKLNLMPWKGLVISTDIAHNYYTGYGNYSTSYILWNGGVGYKFLKNRAADLRLVVFDILSQNSNISRTIASTYIEDSRTKVLTRYFMLMFTYNIRNFKFTPPPSSQYPAPNRNR